MGDRRRSGEPLISLDDDDVDPDDLLARQPAKLLRCEVSRKVSLDLTECD